MTLKAKLLAASTAGITLAAAGQSHAQSSAAASPVQTGYAPVNGLKLYYEIRGSGTPVVVIHGGLGNTELLGGLSQLASTQRMIAVDLQGHGRTADIDRPFRCETMADDIAGLLGYLKIAKADMVGYSLGACVALRVAIQHPDVVCKLVIVSDVFKRSGWYPEGLASMAEFGSSLADAMKPSPNYQVYARIAPRPADWPVLLDKTGDLMRRDFDWTQDVAAITAPTLLVFGDADAMRPEHEIEFFKLLGGGSKDGGVDGSGISKARLAILPGTTHYNILESPLLVPVIAPFLRSDGAPGRTAAR